MGDINKIKKNPSKKLSIFGLQFWYTGKKFEYSGVWFTTKWSWWIIRIIAFNKFWNWFRPINRKK